MKIRSKTQLSALQRQFPALLQLSEPFSDAEFDELTSPQAANKNALVFTNQLKELEQAHANGARAFVVNPKIKGHLGEFTASHFLFSPNVTLALAKVSEFLIEDGAALYLEGVHSSAQISKTAKVGSGVRIGANAVIGDRVVLGDGVSIGPNAVLEGDCTVGAYTNIHALVFIGRRTIIGKNCEIKPGCVIGGPGYGYAHDEKGNHYRIQQLGRVVLEDDVEIGAGCTIDRATFDETRIGRGTKFDNLVHIAHNCKIGKNCLLTAGFMSAGSTDIGDNVVSGGRTSVTDHAKICSNVQLGGLSAVSKDITQPGAYSGYPLQPLKDHLKSTATIALLPRMRKDISRILKHLGLGTDDKEA